MQVMSDLTKSEEWDKFLQTITKVERDREFDRKVDRIKKSSSATTVWAVIPGLLGIYGIAHFYLNKPIEGLVILLTGLIPSLFVMGSFSWLFAPYYYGNPNVLELDAENLIMIGIVAWGVRVAFFIGNIISARYNYSKYEWYIHLKASKPWNNWGLDSKMPLLG